MQTVAQLGEKQTIERLKQYMVSGVRSVVVGPGDDCAVLDSDSDSPLLVLTTDLLIEGTHFTARDQVDWVKLGRKCIAANYSDLAAMGAAPQSVLVSLGVPGSLNIKCLEDLYKGFSQEISSFGGSLVGGDVARSETVVINIAVSGLKPRGAAPCLRSGCKAGQNVYVSGALGGSRAGLDFILNSDAHPANLPEALKRALLERHLVPQPRLELGNYLAATHPDVAIIDISDSLHNELALLSTASGVGMEILLDKVPAYEGLVEYCTAIKSHVQDYLLFSGEEYELLFTCFAEEQQLRSELTEAGVRVPVTKIGTVNVGKGITYRNLHVPVEGKHDMTYRHFTKGS